MKPDYKWLAVGVVVGYLVIPRIQATLAAKAHPAKG